MSIAEVLSGAKQWHVEQGNVFDLLREGGPIAAGSIDTVVTSPPYWRLRSYLPAGHPLKALELGSEKTPAEYVASMVRVFRLVRECLADTGVVWLNVGDSYSGGSGVTATTSTKQRSNSGTMFPPQGKRVDIPSGNLCLIPQRLAIALQDDGWRVRSVVAWHKPAAMPASLSGWRWMRCRVKVRSRGSSSSKAPPGQRNPDSCRNPDLQAQWSDCPGCAKCQDTNGLVLRRGSWRPTSSWEPILMLVKSDHYFCDGEAVKTPPADTTVSRDQYSRILDDPDEQYAVTHDHETICNGANLRDVWRIASEQLQAAHYAAFPTELAQRCLKASTSARGNCAFCGMPWVRVVQTTPVGSYHDHSRDGVEYGLAQASGRPRALDGRPSESNTPPYKSPITLGWRPSCSCVEAGVRPPLVMDPFSGSGRTGVAARLLGLRYIGLELNPEYVALSERLIADALNEAPSRPVKETPLFDTLEGH